MDSRFEYGKRSALIIGLLCSVTIASLIDGSLSSSNVATAANLTVSDAQSTFTNSAAITIPSVGAGTPYPSVINVSGMVGTVRNVTLTLNNLNHSWASDVDVLLVGPAGQKVLVLSDVGSAFAPSNVTVTLS